MSELSKLTFQSALRTLLIAADNEAKAGWLFPGAWVIGWLNIGFGMPVIFASFVVCSAAATVTTLAVFGWNPTVFALWSGYMWATHPACYLDSDGWDKLYLMISIYFGFFTGNDVRKSILSDPSFHWAPLKMPWLRFLARLATAAAITSGVAFAVASHKYVPPGLWSSCAAASIGF